MIFGFDTIENILLNAFRSNRLHHCNLIYGTKGIGKNTFITECIAPVILNIGSIEKTKKLIFGGGHTDFLRLDLNSLTDDNKENTSKKGEINVSQTRRVINEIKMTPSIANYKLLIIDSIDSLNVNAQNVLLKTLEEPPKNTFIFLICHNIDKVIRTIISRSNIIKVPELSMDDWCKAVFSQEEMQAIEIEDDDINTLYDLSNHSVAMAIDILSSDTMSIYDNIFNIVINKDVIEIQKFVQEVTDSDKYSIFCNFMNKFFSDVIHYSFDNLFMYNNKHKDSFNYILKNIGIKKILDYYDNFTKLLHDIDTFNLDKKLAFNIFLNNFK